MGDLSSIQNQVKQKLLLDIVEGVGRFPIPSTSFVLAKPPFDPSCSNISNCKSCSLHELRERVVVAKSFEPKAYFILSDFPDKEDAASTEVFSPSSLLSNIAINLMSKLEIQASCHYSFALKCVPEKGLPSDPFVCANQNLFAEILAVAPKVILCFGHRALQSLISLDCSFKNNPSLVENTECPSICLDTLRIRLFFLSSIRDLKNFPHWRKQVWNVLSPLAKEHSGLLR